MCANISSTVVDNPKCFGSNEQTGIKHARLSAYFECASWCAKSRFSSKVCGPVFTWPTAFMTRSTETKHNLSISFTRGYIQHVFISIRVQSDTGPNEDADDLNNGTLVIGAVQKFYPGETEIDPPFFVQNSQNMACFNHLEE